MGSQVAGRKNASCHMICEVVDSWVTGCDSAVEEACGVLRYRSTHATDANTTFSSHCHSHMSVENNQTIDPLFHSQHPNRDRVKCDMCIFGQRYTPKGDTNLLAITWRSLVSGVAESRAIPCDLCGQYLMRDRVSLELSYSTDVLCQGLRQYWLSLRFSVTCACDRPQPVQCWMLFFTPCPVQFRASSRSPRAYGDEASCLRRSSWHG